MVPRLSGYVPTNLEWNRRRQRISSLHIKPVYDNIFSIEVICGEIQVTDSVRGSRRIEDTSLRTMPILKVKFFID
jgi:hypothetical protein